MSGKEKCGDPSDKMTDDEFRARMRTAVMREAEAGDKQAWPEFAARLSYIPAEYDGDDLQGYAELARRFEMFDGGTGAGVRRQFGRKNLRDP